jgi:predicted aspartyl protease
VTARIENLEDLYLVKKGLLPDEQGRRIEVHDALVDTGASTLPLPKRMVAARGLEPFGRDIRAGPAAIFSCPCTAPRG